jgi:hypothetical protein
MLFRKSDETHKEVDGGLLIRVEHRVVVKPPDVLE